MSTMRKLWTSKSFRLTMVILAVLVAILFLILLVSLGYHADWTGFNRHVEHIPSGQQDQPAKTLWDWLQLLIIPLVLVFGGFLLNVTTSRTEQKIAAQRYENDQKIALDKQREDLLQSYLDRMAELLLEKDLRNSEEDAEVRKVARVRTLTVIGQLDTVRQDAVLSFLREAKLVTVKPGKSIVALSSSSMKRANLQGVDFSNIDLSGVDLSGANLSGADLSGANLSRANLSEADLSRVDLIMADLNGAYLKGTNLSEADLKGANLRGAYLIGADLNLKGADLRGANLSGANLIGADLSKTNLSRTNLSRTNLSRTNLSGANLNGALQLHLFGAMLP